MKEHIARPVKAGHDRLTKYPIYSFIQNVCEICLLLRVNLYFLRLPARGDQSALHDFYRGINFPKNKLFSVLS